MTRHAFQWRPRLSGAVAAVVVASLFSLDAVALAAQTGTIEGKVTAVSSGEPIAGAEVAIPGLNLGARAGADGSFKLLNVPVSDLLGGRRELQANRRRQFSQCHRRWQVADSPFAGWARQRLELIHVESGLFIGVGFAHRRRPLREAPDHSDRRGVDRGLRHREAARAPSQGP